ncbi:MAG: restriction endonuclease [Bacteroidetes bacterium]|nr:restriction endonuclease [Bacteroidota bacterium]
MINKWLFDILKDGTLMDNQIYSAESGVFSDFRIPHAKIELKRRQGKEHSKPQNKETEIWRFLHEVEKETRVAVKNKNSNLIVLRETEYIHNSDDNLFELSGFNCNDFKLSTGNLIGFIRKADYSIKICSRFGDKFLKHIISDADGFLELENSGGNSASMEGYEWLLLYLWKIKLKKSHRLGLPKMYITKKDKTNAVRGKIDERGYYGNYDGKFNCTYREHSYDNDVTKIVAETFRKISGNSIIEDINSIKNAFFTATEGKRMSLKNVDSVAYIKNPFYTEYNSVIDLSRKILKNQLQDFGETSQSSAFLFDVSMLFENFVRKLIVRQGFIVEGNDMVKKIPTGNKSFNRKLLPDLVFHLDGTTFLFDVKYKNFDFIYGVNREDLFQLHTYVGQYLNDFNLGGCGFIYPILETNLNNRENKETIRFQELIIADKKIGFFIVFLPVPHSEEKDFTIRFNENCRKTMEILKDKLLKT